jgi:hypothetical protein
VDVDVDVNVDAEKTHEGGRQGVTTALVQQDTSD